MTPRHAAKCGLPPRLFLALALHDVADLPDQILVLRMGMAIDQKRPVDIAAFRKFIASQRAENNDASVVSNK